jgi:predicted heme/steroid binding protein
MFYHSEILKWSLNKSSLNPCNPVNPGSDDMKEYTKSQLALRNGSDREEIWCAYNGLIYDLKKSRLWRNGKHYEHWAGQDLTEELKDAPHNENVFDKFEAVGKLVN